MRSVVIFLAVVALSGLAWAGEHEHPSKPGESPEYAEFTKAMGAGMGRMMDDMHEPGYSGDPDVDFLAMMIPHHEGAVEMARLVLLHGDDPLVRKLAEDIIAAQTVEIEAMERRLEILRKGADSEPGGFPALGGTRGE